MMNKALEKIYKEPFLCEGGVSLNTNDSMLVSGNSNGDLIVRNLLNPEGSPVDAKLNIEDPKKSHESGVSEVILSHAMSAREKSEVTMVRFSIVKRHVLASSYKNGHVVIWDTQSIFTRAQNPANAINMSQTCKKFVFSAHDGKSCSSIAFSQVNHLLLASCGHDGRVYFYDITQGKEVKKIDVN